MRSPSSITSTSPGTRRSASITCSCPSRRTFACVGQVGGERLDRSLGLHLLGEREGRVDQDHHDDRHRDRDDPGGPGQARGRPQQQGERMDELPHELPRPAPPAPPRQHVRPELDQPPLRLARGQPRQRAPQVTQQQLDPLRRIDRAARRRVVGRAHDPRLTRVIRAPAHRDAACASRRPATRLGIRAARSSPRNRASAHQPLTTRRRPRRRRDEPTTIATFPFPPPLPPPPLLIAPGVTTLVAIVGEQVVGVIKLNRTASSRRTFPCS